MTATTSGLSQELRDLLAELGTSLDTGLTHEQVRSRRLESSSNANNVVSPPIRCPAWICCLLPCIKSFPSMKAFRAITPHDAEVKRAGRWVRYDATSLLAGDVVRIEAGDVVPADCVVLSVQGDPLLVDMRLVTGQPKPCGAAPSSRLFWGGRVVQGAALCAVTAVGDGTRVAELIRSRKFPPEVSTTDATDALEIGGGAAADVGVDDDEESGSSSSSPAEQGISLLSRRMA